MPGSKERDLRKYYAAISSGHEFISLFEDEWLLSPEKVKLFLTNRLSFGFPESLRPSKCSITLIDSTEARRFLDANHYIGFSPAKVHYGVFHGGSIIAAASFRHPARQTSSYEWELSRMSSDSSYRIHGIWSKLLRRFVRDFSPSSVVSFSDNRLFTGSVYERIGFSYDGEVRPDYYWVKGLRRFHKSGLRKRGAERSSGITEAELREAQGYRRIWDLGKKRWVFRA